VVLECQPNPLGQGQLSFGYSAFACLRIGISGSAFFQRAKKVLAGGTGLGKGIAWERGHFARSLFFLDGGRDARAPSLPSPLELESAAATDRGQWSDQRLTMETSGTGPLSGTCAMKPPTPASQEKRGVGANRAGKTPMLPGRSWVG
jgi:hypothetical protein